MNFEMTKPCENCPFRTDCPEEWLGEARATEILESLSVRDESFPCHKTTTLVDDDNDEDGSQRINREDEQHCAGAMILLEKLDRPNQMMRIMGRLSGYDPKKLDMEQPVFDNGDEFIAHHTRREKPRKRKSRKRTS